MTRPTDIAVMRDKVLRTLRENAQLYYDEDIEARQHDIVARIADALMAIPAAQPDLRDDNTKASDMLMEASEFFGATLADADPRAWAHLLVYAPKGPRDEALRIAREALDSIRQYGADTLSGPAGSQYREKWFRDGVFEMRRRANAAIDKLKE